MSQKPKVPAASTATSSAYGPSQLLRQGGVSARPARATTVTTVATLRYEPSCPTLASAPASAASSSTASDHQKAASAAADTSVSTVAVPRRGARQAARWNAAAPHATTGAARHSESHVQPANCSADTTASVTTGAVSAPHAGSRSHASFCTSLMAVGAVRGP